MGATEQHFPVVLTVYAVQSASVDEIIKCDHPSENTGKYFLLYCSFHNYAGSNCCCECVGRTLMALQFDESFD